MSGKSNPATHAIVAERRSGPSSSGPAERRHLLAAGSAVEAADLHVDRVDGPAADRLHDVVARSSSAPAPARRRAGAAAPSPPRPGTRGSRGRGACGRAARGSGSTRRSRGAAAGPRPRAVDARRRRRPPPPRRRYIWYATGQMPQIRAVRSGASVARDRAGTPRRSGAARRSAARRPPPGRRDLDTERALALDAGEPLDRDRASALVGGRHARAPRSWRGRGRTAGG